tara:strand:- start:71 stop:709 length:639 start_codon:yes stop_codon:yes gene_type:complete
MTIRISHGIEEDGIVTGNAFDKYGSRNPLVKWMMSGFENTIQDLTSGLRSGTIHEVGCGEGFWTLRWLAEGCNVQGSDFSKEIVSIAKSNAIARNLSPDVFQQRSIYDLNVEDDAADLVLCCEVLEHLEHPEQALDVLHSITRGHLLISVPNEPLWRVLNLARFSYIADLGNTPGHIQHWSTAGFKKFVSTRFDVLEAHSPLPWTVLLCRPK